MSDYCCPAHEENYFFSSAVLGFSIVVVGGWGEGRVEGTGGGGAAAWRGRQQGGGGRGEAITTKTNAANKKNYISDSGNFFFPGERAGAAITDTD